MLSDTVNQLRKEAYGEVCHWLKYYGQSKMCREDVQKVLETMTSKYINKCHALVNQYQKEHPRTSLYLNAAIVACNSSLIPSGDEIEVAQSYQDNYVAQKMNTDYLAFTSCQGFIKRYTTSPSMVINEQWEEIDSHWKEIVQNMQDYKRHFQSLDNFIAYSGVSKDTIYAKNRSTTQETFQTLLNKFNCPFEDIPGASFTVNENMLRWGVFAYKCHLAMKEQSIDIATLHNLTGIDSDTLHNILDGTAAVTAAQFEQINKQLAKPLVYFFYFLCDTKTKTLGIEPLLQFKDKDFNDWFSRQRFKNAEPSYFGDFDADGYETRLPEPNPYYWPDRKEEYASNAGDKTAVKEFEEIMNAFSALM